MARHGQLSIVNDACTVHGNGLKDSSFHEIDNDRIQPDLDGMGPHGKDNHSPGIMRVEDPINHFGEVTCRRGFLGATEAIASVLLPFPRLCRNASRSTLLVLSFREKAFTFSKEIGSQSGTPNPPLSLVGKECSPRAGRGCGPQRYGSPESLPSCCFSPPEQYPRDC